MAIDLTIPLFPFQPDWSATFQERLEFRTDAIGAMDGSEQTRRVRMTPRRRFEFLVSEVGDTRQAMANLAWARGARRVYLPLWVEGGQLSAPASGEADSIQLLRGADDFAPGMVAMLRGQNPANAALVEVDSVAGSVVTLKAAAGFDYSRGDWLVPVRRARYDGAVEWGAFNRSMTYGRQRFLIDEANPHEALAPATVYRGFPVLTTRPSYARDPETSLDRMAYRVDDDVGRVIEHDEVGVPLYRQVHNWNLDGRQALRAFRGLLYALQGRQRSLWVPTWLDDLTVAATVAAGANTVRVAWSGYARRIAQAMNRRDLRIELASGAVVYRRILASVDNGDGTETLTLDGSIAGTATPAARVAQVSFMGLCRSDSDQFEFGWWHGEYADVATAWRATVHDV